jgi:hypothetical protein
MNNNNQNNRSAKNMIFGVPAKSYPNSDTYKAQILSENTKKSGIYM